MWGFQSRTIYWNRPHPFHGFMWQLMPCPRACEMHKDRGSTFKNGQKKERKMIKQWAKKKKKKKQKAWLVCKKIKLSFFFFLQCLAFTALNEWGCSARASHRRERAFSFLPAAQRRDFCLSEGGERTMWRNINLLFCAKLIRITSLASVKKPWSHHSGSVCIFFFILVGEQEKWSSEVQALLRV